MTRPPVERASLVHTVKQPSMQRCLQCRKLQRAQCRAAYADVIHRPVIVQECVHGPFCPRCRRSIATQVLPLCVCHALVDSWHDATWPACAEDSINDGRLSKMTKSENHMVLPASGLDVSRQRLRKSVVPSPEPSAGVNLTDAQFVSWDSFGLDRGSQASFSPSPANLTLDAPGASNICGPMPQPEISASEATPMDASTEAVPVQGSQPPLVDLKRALAAEERDNAYPRVRTRTDPGAAVAADLDAAAVTGAAPRVSGCVANFALQAAAAAARRRRK